LLTPYTCLHDLPKDIKSNVSFHQKQLITCVVGYSHQRWQQALEKPSENYTDKNPKA